MPSSESDSNSHRRPQYLPPPTVVPLRYCSHNEDDTPIDEASCLLSLLSPSAEAKKNKEHYVIATADPPVIQESSSSSSNTQQKRKRNSVAPQQPRYNLRRDARSIPGVPIIYVKRSVMVLEPMSGATENVREGFERGKLKTGVTSLTGKRKRDEEDPAPKTAKVKKVKGPNPLSVKKPKSRRDLESEGSKPASRAPDAGSAPANENTGDIQSDSGEQQTKAKRKRRHKSHRPGGEPSEVEASIPAES
jgi:U3 small nucleolar RNA-associated protein 23